MNQATRLFLKIGLAFIFLYAGTAALFRPQDWAMFVPSAFSGVVGLGLLIKLHAIFEIILGLLFLTEFKQKLIAILAAIDLAAIIFFNASNLFITFRDVGLLLMALAYWQEQRK